MTVKWNKENERVIAQTGNRWGYNYQGEEITTTDLAKFGGRELRQAAELLAAYCEGARPADFDADGVCVMFNMRSGMVFLTNDECQVVVSDGQGDLRSFYTSPYEGHEGTLFDLRTDFNRDDWDQEDIEWLEDLCADAGVSL